jgi:hypothetical protein
MRRLTSSATSAAGRARHDDAAVDHTTPHTRHTTPHMTQKHTTRTRHTTHTRHTHTHHARGKLHAVAPAARAMGGGVYSLTVCCVEGHGGHLFILCDCDLM